MARKTARSSTRLNLLQAENAFLSIFPGVEGTDISESPKSQRGRVFPQYISVLPSASPQESLIMIPLCDACKWVAGRNKDG